MMELNLEQEQLELELEPLELQQLSSHLDCQDRTDLPIVGWHQLLDGRTLDQGSPLDQLVQEQQEQMELEQLQPEQEQEEGLVLDDLVQCWLLGQFDLSSVQPVFYQEDDDGQV
jgi:hypothetical protein